MKNTSEAPKLENNPNASGQLKDSTVSALSKHAIVADDITHNTSPRGWPPTEYDFGYNHIDVENDLSIVRKMQDREIERLQRRARRTLGQQHRNLTPEEIGRQMALEEDTISKQFENVLYDGIGRQGWLNPSVKDNALNVRSLTSVKNIDDYCNRIDAPFCIDFSETKKRPAERIFIGFDATVDLNQDRIDEKLTMSTNVTTVASRELKLPFGFSTLRYTYDPAAYELLPSDEVIRYTICASKPQIKKMKKYTGKEEFINPETKDIAYQEICFKVLSQIYEQNLFYLTMNEDNSKVCEKISRLNNNVWRNLGRVSVNLAKNMPKLGHLSKLANDTRSIITNFKDMSEEEKKNARAKINNNYRELYADIKINFRRGDAGGTPDTNYTKCLQTIEGYTKAAKQGKLDQFKTLQARNIAFDTEGKIFKLDEDGNKVYK